MRLSKAQAQVVRDGLVAALDGEVFIHPSWLPNEYSGVWISDSQKRAYLRSLADAGVLEAVLHERGWYKYYTYRVKATGEVENDGN